MSINHLIKSSPISPPPHHHHFHLHHLQTLPRLRSDFQHYHLKSNCQYQMHLKLDQLNFLQLSHYCFHYHFHLEVAQLEHCLHKKYHLSFIIHLSSYFVSSNERLSNNFFYLSTFLLQVVHHIN